ncbi:MAG TPA: hypothetical protein H9785_10630 [Candidatus Bacteroides intestinavium]|uniref:Major fimbrial subunit protein N-terminal domain-containing protein n=1 Tax=Candidatus Bacteroides intestinavium TaxID=2838469 RepID=A0A9D2KTK2_9BACE|nr:hypothetical protein [Candidatus Bacteroides intestinavium]
MKRRSSFFILSSSVLILLLAACQGDELPLTPQPQNPSVLTFTVAAETAETRSVPESPSTETGKGVQYVQNVKLYLFKEGDGSTTYVGMEEPIWKNLSIESGGEAVNSEIEANKAGHSTVSKSYPLQTALEPNTTYTLLAVGYEKDAIYDIQTNGQSLEGLKERTDNGDGTYTDGAEVTLSDLSSVLTSGKDKSNIQSNEYFTGTETATTDADGRLPEGTTVTMRRRVAGLSACFKLTNFSRQPAAVAIMLWKDPYKDVPTLRRIWQQPNFTDHGETALTSSTEDAPNMSPQCLLWLDFKQENTGIENYINTDEEDPDDSDDEDTSGIDDNDKDKNSTYITEVQSGYVLPIEAPGIDEEKNYTLAVVVYTQEGEKYRAICTKRAALAEDGNLIFATDLGTGIVDDESYYRYPIVANRFYRFGTGSKPLEVEYDENNPFEVIVEPGWEGMPDLGFGENEE